MRFVIVTGMSGAGKGTALKMLEDSGYFCVSNLPVKLIVTFAKLVIEEATEISKAAVGVDVRSGLSQEQMNEALKELRERGYHYEILFLDASDETLLLRYKETRRTHPLAGQDRIEKGIEKEREVLAFLREQSDYLINTDDLLTRSLKEKLDNLFLDEKAIQNLLVNLVSFGYKYGIPADCDLVFDVRFLPNPYYVEELKHQTGQDSAVWDYIASSGAAGVFLGKLENLLRWLIPQYVAEGKYRLVIGIGCTGGHHRSVGIAEELYRRLADGDYGIILEHRDIDK